MTPELLTFLLNNGYDPNKAEHPERAVEFCTSFPQSFARYDQKYEMLKALLKHGVNPNVTTLGDPVLHHLIHDHKKNPYQLEMIQLLLDAGADVNVLDRDGNTPLDIAMLFEAAQPDDPKNAKLVDLFKHYGAKRRIDL